MRLWRSPNSLQKPFFPGSPIKTRRIARYTAHHTAPPARTRPLSTPRQGRRIQASPAFGQINRKMRRCIAVLALLHCGRASGQCVTDADCSGCGSTWGPGVGGGRPAGCNGPCPGTCGGGGVDYTTPGLKVVPTRGTTGNANDANLVYGPFEAGFSADRKCLSDHSAARLHTGPLSVHTGTHPRPRY